MEQHGRAGEGEGGRVAGWLGRGTWAVMTAWDYYITARHEIDPLYTNKKKSAKAVFKMFFNHMI